MGWGRARVAPSDEKNDANDGKVQKNAQKAARKFFSTHHKRSLLQPLSVEATALSTFFYALLSSFPRIFTGSAKIKGLPAAAIRLLNLSKNHLRLLKVAFNKLDDDESGTLEVIEFLNFFELRDTPFLRRVLKKTVLAAGDLDEDEAISFDEFVLLCTILCTDSKDQVMWRCFTLFDLDSSGFIDERELKILTENVSGMMTGGNFPGNTRLLLASLDTDGNGVRISLQTAEMRGPLIYGSHTLYSI